MRAEWRTHWPLVLAAAVGFSFHSIVTYSIGLFIQPLSEEFGWSRAQITAGLTLAAISTVPLSPVVGTLIDRWGTRRLALPGLLLTSLSLASFGLANGSNSQWLALWAFYALVALAVKSTVWTTAVAKVFFEGRGLAMAVVLCGTAITQILAPPITRLLIDTVGWREAYFWLAAAWGGPTLILAVFFLFDSHDIAKGHGKKLGSQNLLSDALSGLTLRAALRNSSLLRIALATLIMMLLGIAVIVHQVPILTEAGVTRERAAYLASLSGVAGIAGKIITGWLMDRYHGAKVGGITLGISGVAFLMLLEPIRTPGLIVLSMIIIGYATGAKLQVTAYLTGRYGGMRNFGALFGTMSSLLAIGAGFGPVIAGAIFDYSGSYEPLLLIGFPAMLFCAILIYSLGPYPVWAEIERA